MKIWLPHKNSNHYNVYFEKYQEEVQKLAILKDPSIITVYSADITSHGYYYSTMEWVQGVTLKKFLKQKNSLSHKTRFEILDTILSSITECHKINLFHGDLHPENILIEIAGKYDSEYKAKILDFGTSLLNRKNKPEYNKQRESALLLETSLKLLDEENQNDLLKFKFYSSSDTKKVKMRNLDDVRNYHPLLVSTTLKNLNKLYYIVESNHVNEAVIYDALDLLLNSTGIDINKFLNYLLSKMDQKDDEFMRKFSIILSAKIYDYLFEVDMFSHREYELIACYYELLKNPVTTLNKEFNSIFNNYDENTFDYNQILYLDSLETVLQLGL